jgi:hypothetical protein
MFHAAEQLPLFLRFFAADLRFEADPAQGRAEFPFLAASTTESRD